MDGVVVCQGRKRFGRGGVDIKDLEFIFTYVELRGFWDSKKRYLKEV